jgi:hypothetical protein
VIPLLDGIPSMDMAGRSQVDALLMWMTSVCLLNQSLRMSWAPGLIPASVLT